MLARFSPWSLAPKAKEQSYYMYQPITIIKAKSWVNHNIATQVLWLEGIFLRWSLFEVYERTLLWGNRHFSRSACPTLPCILFSLPSVTNDIFIYFVRKCWTGMTIHFFTEVLRHFSLDHLSAQLHSRCKKTAVLCLYVNHLYLSHMYRASFFFGRGGGGGWQHHSMWIVIPKSASA